MATPESKTKQRIKAVLAEFGVYYFMPAANGYGRAGIPDFICCVNGCFFAIEAKAAGGSTTALQEREMERIRHNGGFTLLVYNTDEDFARLRKVLHHILEKQHGQA